MSHVTHKIGGGDLTRTAMAAGVSAARDEATAEPAASVFNPVSYAVLSVSYLTLERRVASL